MNDFFDGLTRMADTFFNRRPAPKAESESKVTIGELIRRKVSHVSYDGKLYRIECSEVEVKEA
jgi:hypothetical protein